MSYGRASYPKTVHCNRTSLRKGINNFKSSYGVLKKWYSGEVWLKENSIVVAANGSNDGVW
ncbi:hypothetical protein [Alteromonas macleodii]|uniref:hypothetical protein n=1 Tax=Alteromonas macleodii TaxID=28108 RepID=UPI0018D9EA1B|nr:hypothetical protein [Alteromonas macleodii]